MSEAVFRSDKIREVDGSSIQFCWAEFVILSHNVAAHDFRYLRDFHFLATVLFEVGGGNRKGGSSISVGSDRWIGRGAMAGAASFGDRAGLRANTEELN